MAFRSAQSHAAFLLPKLRPGMRLLDCGCGPGTITCGLARIVAPAEVIGLDREGSQIERAREDAASQNISNVRFDTGSIYELPFADGSFEVVFAHAVFEHLREPLSALSEIHRVLAAGGMVALRSPDWGGFLVSPMTPELEAALTYYQRLQMQSGGDVQVGRKFKALLREAGFRELEFSAAYECYGSLESIGEYLAERIDRSAENSMTPGDKERIENHAAALRSWYRSEDGVFAQSWCEILGTK
jgi:ubiquinone/menaquinone biosynthesis C-methylase UbiE